MVVDCMGICKRQVYREIELRDGVSIDGMVSLTVRRGDRIEMIICGGNLVTTVGKNLCAEYFELTPGPARPGWIALGDDDAVALPTNTTLANETFRDAILSRTRSDNEVNLNVIHTAAGTETLKECGIFNDAVAGTMISRFIFQQVTLALNDTLEIDWTLNFGGS